MDSTASLVINRFTRKPFLHPQCEEHSPPTMHHARLTQQQQQQAFWSTASALSVRSDPLGLRRPRGSGPEPPAAVAAGDDEDVGTGHRLRCRLQGNQRDCDNLIITAATDTWLHPQPGAANTVSCPQQAPVTETQEARGRHDDPVWHIRRTELKPIER